MPLLYIDGDVRVRVHCHLTGKYRGLSHQACNLQYQETRIVPVVFHNSSHYDLHFIIKQLAKMPGNISAILLNDGLYISFTKTMLSVNLEKYADFIKFRWVFCYEEALPSKEVFYRTLTESHISDEDYELAYNV